MLAPFLACLYNETNKEQGQQSTVALVGVKKGKKRGSTKQTQGRKDNGTKQNRTQVVF